jgi:hypothetical protein
VPSIDKHNDGTIMSHQSISITMAHRHLLDTPIHCQFLAASVQWERISLPHLKNDDEPWFRPRLTPKMKARAIDPWQARAEFLRLPLPFEHPRSDTAAEALLDFLNRVGLWHQLPHWETAHIPRKDYQEGILDTGQFVYGEERRPLDFFRDLQSILGDLMINKAELKKYILKDRPKNLDEAEQVAMRDDRFSLTFDWGEKVPKPTITTVCFWSAVLLSLQIDHVRGCSFRTCARADCGIPYPVTNLHKRKYCSQYCGHLESLRRQRRTINPNNRRTRKET